MFLSVQCNNSLVQSVQKRIFQKAEWRVTWLNVLFPLGLAALYLASLYSNFVTINSNDKNTICANQFYYAKVAIYAAAMFFFPMYWVMFTSLVVRERNHVWRKFKYWFLFVLIGQITSIGIKLILGGFSNIFY